MTKNRYRYKILHFEITANQRKLQFNTFLEVKKQNFDYFKNIISEGQEKGVFRKDINLVLIPSTIVGTYFQFYTIRMLYGPMLGLETDEAVDHYVNNELTAHLKQTIKALLTHED